jgi:hypothetical protein
VKEATRKMIRLALESDDTVDDAGRTAILAFPKRVVPAAANRWERSGRAAKGAAGKGVTSSSPLGLPKQGVADLPHRQTVHLGGQSPN